jgi:hypothetical protein
LFSGDRSRIDLIAVFAELGGSKILGKARELADRTGQRVIAFCSKAKRDTALKLIALGADRVVICDANSTREWAFFLASQVEEGNEESSRLILLPSSDFGNVILGRLSTVEGLDFILEGADFFDIGSACKSLLQGSVNLCSKTKGGNLSVLSVRVDKIPEAFEDSTKSGKVEEKSVGGATGVPPSPLHEENPIADLQLSQMTREFTDPRTVLNILVGRKYFEEGQREATRERLLKTLARRYEADLKVEEGRLESIYGPCLALEVKSRLSDLPDFEGELIAINTSRRDPIQRIATTKIVTYDIDSLVSSLLSLGEKEEEDSHE